MFDIFIDFYSLYFGFFYELVLFMYPYELSDFICSFWPICKSFFGVLYIKMFSIS